MLRAGAPDFQCNSKVPAQKLGRKWIGIDVTYLAINLIKRRLKDAFGDEIAFEERGHPPISKARNVSPS